MTVHHEYACDHGPVPVEDPTDPDETIPTECPECGAAWVGAWTNPDGDRPEVFD